MTPVNPSMRPRDHDDMGGSALGRRGLGRPGSIARQSRPRDRAAVRSAGVSAHSRNDPSRGARCTRSSQCAPAPECGSGVMTSAASMSVRRSDRLRRLMLASVRLSPRASFERALMPETRLRARASRTAQHARACGRRRRAHGVLAVAVHARGISPPRIHARPDPPPATAPRSRPRDHAPPISVRRCGSRLLEDNPAEVPGPPLRFGPSGVFVADRRDSAHAGGGWSRAGDKEGAVKWLPSVP